ncbi:MAG TPA: hypothetical protein DDZ39_07900, partial [Flavobacteriaceae bacterium]|nr:hypothetical protein [Flavobacteriaceae bacterium]
MKKKILYTFVALTVLLLLVYLFRYNQSQVFEGRVPKDATTVVNVNLRQIENDLLFDFLAHPITYLKSRRREKDSIKKNKFPFINGIEIPENVLFFSNESTFKNHWLSTVFNLKDKEKFTHYFLREKFVKSSLGAIEFYTKGNLVLAIYKDKLIHVIKSRDFGSTEDDISKMVTSVFNESEFLSQESELLKPISTSKSDLSFSSTNTSFLEVNFKEGLLEVTGNLVSDFFMTSTSSEIVGNPVGFFTAKINKGNVHFKNIVAKGKVKFDRFTHLSLDSIVRKWNGKLNLNLISIENITDTIVTYEFDDDFNKVKKIATQEKAIPSLDIRLGKESQSDLSAYFWRKNAIQVHNNDTVFAALPIYKFDVVDANDIFELTSGQNFSSQDSKTTKSRLNFYFDMEKYLQQPLDVPLNSKQLKVLELIKSSSIFWSENNEISLKIEM